MRNGFLVLLFSFYGATALLAQGATSIFKVHDIGFVNKQLWMLGYDVGIRKLCFNINAGFGNGKDDQFLPADKVQDGKSVQKVRASQVVFPANSPANSYLESCNTTYKVQQLRLGMTIFPRRNDTLGRHPLTGPHLGVEAMYTKTIESQTVVYKSEINDTRYSYSGINRFTEIGAGSHLGWQFAFFKEHLYVDFRGAIVFYWPQTPEPNLNSPFAGNKWELQASLGWHFYSKPKEKVKDGDKDQIRNKI